MTLHQRLQQSELGRRELELDVVDRCPVRLDIDSNRTRRQSPAPSGYAVLPDATQDRVSSRTSSRGLNGFVR